MPSGTPNTPCKMCGKLFYSCPSMRKLGKGKYCSNACAALDPERRAAISKRFKGKPHTPEWNAKISASNMGKHMSPESREKMRKAKLGGTLSPEHRKKIGLAGKGKTKSNACKEKLRSQRKGDKNPAWKGGITPLQKSIRTHPKYLEWVLAVFTRDKFTCQDCGNVGRKLEAHHIKHFAQIIEENHILTVDMALACEELWDIFNGITLCIKCHKQRHSRKQFL